jgi:hypothetical protein
MTSDDLNDLLRVRTVFGRVPFVVCLAARDEKEVAAKVLHPLRASRARKTAVVLVRKGERELDDVGRQALMCTMCVCAVEDFISQIPIEYPGRDWWAKRGECASLSMEFYDRYVDVGISAECGSLVQVGLGVVAKQCGRDSGRKAVGEGASSIRKMSIVKLILPLCKVGFLASCVISLS